MPRSHTKDSTNIIKTLAGRDSELDEQLSIDKHRDKAIPVWLTVGDPGQPAFENGWVNYGGGLPGAAFWRSKSGVVYLRGMVMNGTLNTTIFTLPVGFRPGAYSHFPAIGNNAFARISVGVDGIVQGYFQTAWISLDGVIFRVEG